MSERIIIDGYNLIRQSDRLFALEALSLEEGRKGLITLLAPYRREKGLEITVVFDGWKSDNIGTSRERLQGIDVVYSGKGERADEVIKRMAGELRDRAVVVTSDREIARFAEKKGAAVIPSPDFEQKVRTIDATGEPYDPYGEDEEEVGGRLDTQKKGPAFKLSKEERRRRKKLKKL